MSGYRAENDREYAWLLARFEQIDPAKFTGLPQLPLAVAIAIESGDRLAAVDELLCWAIDSEVWEYAGRHRASPRDVALAAVRVVGLRLPPLSEAAESYARERRDER